MQEIIDAVSTPGILALLAYPIGIYAVTGAIKSLVNGNGKAAAAVHRVVSILPVLLGVLSAPFVAPYLLAELGSSADKIPVAVSLFFGASAGAWSKVMWDTINKVIRRRIGDDDELEG